MAIMSVANAFHHNGVNVCHAQLVFATHAIFLDKSLLRSDEIKFVEQDDDTGESETYALSDFGTSGPFGVRRTDDYQQKYRNGCHGGIKNIDLVPFLREQVARGLNVDPARVETDNLTGDEGSTEKVDADAEWQATEREDRLRVVVRRKRLCHSVP